MAKKGQEVVENTTYTEIIEINDDGFQKGQEISEKDYFKFISEQRNQIKEENQGE